MFAAGGILVTTSSTGTVTRAPELTTLTAAVISPDFFFDDQATALDERALEHELNHAAPIKAPARETDDAQSRRRVIAVNEAMASVSTEQSSAAAPVLRNDAEGAEQLFDDTLVLEGAMPLLTTPASSSSPRTPTARVRSNAPTGLPATTMTKVIVASGDTLSGLLHANGIKGVDLARLLSQEIVADELSRLRVGQDFAIERDASGAFVSLTSRASADRRITINREDSRFVVAAKDLPLEKERVVTSGTIQQSLYLAAEQADLKQSTIMELADIFQWELDFARDIRRGDHFSIVYDRLFREGQYIGDGDILAAEFVRGGRTYQAIRFTTDDGKSAYYTPSGESKRRTFLRHPVDIVRITSKFDPNRLHPVLHQIRAHKGVDYGSPHGSPIRATADGTVTKASPYGAYGNTVILKHGRNTSTLYAHMSRISDRSIAGKRVSQGDVIGYVGRTGRVTGTHLHYEFRINGEHVDPLTVELPAAEPIAKQYRAALKAVSDEMIAQMQSVLPSSDKQVASISADTTGLPQ